MSFGSEHSRSIPRHGGQSSNAVELFYSYSHKDEQLRGELEAHLSILKRQGVITDWNDRKISAGTEWKGEIDRHLNTARIILLLISSDFLASDYCYDIEMERAIARQESGEARVIPVILRPCDWSGGPFAKLAALPRHGKAVTSWPNQDQALEDIAVGIRTAVEEVRAGRFIAPDNAPAADPKGLSPSSLPRIWNVPHLRNPNFTGRKELLRDLRDALTYGRHATLIQAMHGLGGVGKTQTAVEYVYQHSSEYDLIWWVRSEERGKLADDYARLAIPLELTAKEEKDQKIVIRAVRGALAERTRWLLVFDNAQGPEEIRDYLPSGNTGHILVTSRNPAFGGVAHPLKIDKLTSAEAEEFLQKRTQRSEPEAAAALAEALGCLPLALEHAGAYVEKTATTLSDYLKIFNTRQTDILNRATQPEGYDATVATTWELSFIELESRSKAAAQLMNLCAFLAPDDIARDMLRDGAKHLPEPLSAAVTDDLVWTDTVGELRRYSLVEVNSDGLSVHRLVQAVARERLTEAERKQWAESAVNIVDSAFSSAAFSLAGEDVQTWKRHARLLPHARIAAERSTHLQVAGEPAGRLLDRVKRYFRVRLFEDFENLMPFRVNDILLVSSLYDSFNLREDGRLNELLIGESLELDIHQVPGVTHVSTGTEALTLARSQPRFNLIVTNLQMADMDAAQLAREIKAAGLDVPVAVLAYEYREIMNFIAHNPQTDIERIFLWQGNARILISIVKYIEDKRNVLHDTRAMDVPVILIVEDDIRCYSSFLPIIYTELIGQSRRLLTKGINVAHKLVRMRARPKVLLSSSYEDAERQARKYADHLLAVISDVEFAHTSEKTPEAGFELARMIRSMVPDVPIVLQSSRAEFMERAYAEGFEFLQKSSHTLLGDLRRILTDRVGFGDFVFYLPDKKAEVGRASDLNALESLMATVPADSIAYHCERNHFSRWLMARTEFALAQKLRPRKVSDFIDTEHLRRDLIDSIAEYRRDQRQAPISEFNPATFQGAESFFLQIGGGSLGGKARGLAFIRHLLHQRRIGHSYTGIRIGVPATVVLATEVFDRFLKENNLLDVAIHGTDDDEIVQQFLAASLPPDLIDNLLAFLQEVRYPLAVRSSSLLEDSQYQHFSGVYETFMLTNQNADIQLRLEQLMQAIKLVYASTFSQHAKAYVRATPYLLEEEKMAVLLQQVVGATHGTRFYPEFSGVVRSRNFYPHPPARVEDGFAAVALGLGRAVVGGGKCLTFSPRYPHHHVQFSTLEDILANSQTEFWALDLDHAAGSDDPAADLREVPFGVREAETDGTLQMLGSTYSADNNAIYDGLSRHGQRIVTFAPILKHEMFPLPGILDRLMKVGDDALGRPVEIEFAVRLPQRQNEPADFGFLQLRPLVLSREGEELRMEDVDPDRLVCQSSKVLGNGRVRDLRDVVVVDFHRFERARSQEVAEGVAHLNAKLSESGTPYLLIGVGRWGSNDPWLGIPVEWDEISGARVIVEAGFRDFRVMPSQGSHFFQNLTAFQIGYFTVNPDANDGFVGWEWLAAQRAVEEHGGVRHLQFANPLIVVMNGKTSQGMILKPESSS